jgi:hypothetical protein
MPMRKFKITALTVALLFYASLLPPPVSSIDYRNYDAHNVTGDGTGSIAGFYIPLYLSNYLSMYDALTVQKNVLMYAADNTGVTDSTSAAYDAIAALGAGGGDILFPPGIFKVNIVLTQSNIGIVGSIMSKDTNIFSRLEPYDITKPVIQIGNDTGEVSGWRLRNLSLQGNNTGTKGLYLAGGATSGTYENIAIAFFTEYNLRIQAGHTYPTTFNFGDKLFLAPSNTSSTSAIRTVIVRDNYPTDSYTTANFISHAQIYGADNGYTVELDSATITMSNSWLEVFNNHGLKLSKNGTALPFLYGSNVFIDSSNSNDTLVNWYDNNGYFTSNIFGTVSIDGKYALDNGTTSNSMSGRIGNFYQPNIYNAYHTGPLNFGESSDYNPISTYFITKSGSSFWMQGSGTIRLNPDSGASTGVVSIGYDNGILQVGRLIPKSLPTSSPGAGSHELWYNPSDNTVHYAP